MRYTSLLAIDESDCVYRNHARHTESPAHHSDVISVGFVIDGLLLKLEPRFEPSGSL